MVAATGSGTWIYCTRRSTSFRRFLTSPSVARRSTDGKQLSYVFWFSSQSPSADAYLGAKNGASGFIADLLGGKNAITADAEWPTLGWESIIAASPDVIVVASLDRNRWELDKPEAKIKFLNSDPDDLTPIPQSDHFRRMLACDRRVDLDRKALVKQYGASLSFEQLRRRISMGCPRMVSDDGIDRC